MGTAEQQTIPDRFLSSDRLIARMRAFQQNRMAQSRLMTSGRLGKLRFMFGAKQ